MTKLTAQSTTSRVLKTLGIFGGVQAVSIMCSVARTKLAALLIGPAGVGYLAVFQSTLEITQKSSQLNLSQSGLRDISVARTQGAQQAQLYSAVLRRIMYTLAIAGTILMAACSPLLSQWGFGDYSHSWDFAAVALCVFFAISADCELTVMRAYEQLRPLAKVTTWNAVFTLMAAVPLYWFLGIRGVVPLLVTAYAGNAALAWYWRTKGSFGVHVPMRTAWRMGIPMLKLGAYMTVSAFVTLLASNIFVVYLNRWHSETAVGLYQAGYMLVNTYVGLIFNAIAMEYYPRLTTVAAHARRTEVVVSHEIKIALLVLMPVVVAFVCLAPLAMHILYSDRFVDALPFVVIGATGVFFRAVSWCLAFTILARNDGRIYILTESLSSLSFLLLYIPLYNAYGFTGLGWAYVAWYGLYALVTYLVYRHRYGLRLRPGIAALLWTATALAAATLLMRHFIGDWWTIAILLPPTAYFSIKNLRRKQA